jgi:hypothetical protein
VRSGAWILLGALALAPPARAEYAAKETRAANATVLALLHDGRFSLARKLLPPQAADPDQAFLAAFVTYWNLVFDDENTDLQHTMEAQIQSVLDLCDGSQKRGDDPAGTAVWGGTAHLLLAELRAEQRRPLGAAFEAKKAKKILEAASHGGADTSDALFALGTYNYMADTVPAYVKGLRALLFLPKGDRDLGLSQLQTAASSSPHFGFEARVLLITIYANRHEKLYDDALGQAARLLADAPGTIGALYAAARLEISLGRNADALRRIEEAFARARVLGDVDGVVLRSLDLLRARAEFAELRPDLAAATARSALGSPDGLTREIRGDLENLRAAGEYNADGIPWQKVDASGTAEGLAALAGEAPGRPLLAILAGDAYLRAGRPQDALVWLRRADTPQLPPGLVGPRLLRQGQAADLLGQRPLALTCYRRAADLSGFPAKDAAVYFQQTPYQAVR